jgi:hypothetical protein
MELRESSFVVVSVRNGREGSAASEELSRCGITIGSLLLVPRGTLNIRFKEKAKQYGLQTFAVHPQFSTEETTYLLDNIFVSIKRRIEGLLRSLDACTALEDTEREVLAEEVKWIKKVLASYWRGEACDEVKRVNDLADVLISRIIELSRVQVLKVVKIEH